MPRCDGVDADVVMADPFSAVFPCALSEYQMALNLLLQDRCVERDSAAETSILGDIGHGDVSGNVCVHYER
jgi:hypothetical protein